MQRNDVFLIWGSGIQHISEILSMIRDSFEIIMIHRHNINDMEQFIDDCYACDSYPLAHLRGKTRYLLDTPQECFFILVRNHHVNEKIVGEGEFKKPQCMYLQEVKNRIRAKFNPGPDQHVIHGTDYESQVSHLIQVFDLGPLHKYFNEPHRDIKYPWHIDPFEKYIKAVVKIDHLRIEVFDVGLVEVKDSPHYKYVCGDKDEYIHYWNKNMGRALMEDHSPEAFDILIENWNGKYDLIIINQKLHIRDGAHRVAIMRHENFLSVNAYVI